MRKYWYVQTVNCGTVSGSGLQPTLLEDVLVGFRHTLVSAESDEEAYRVGFAALELVPWAEGEDGILNDYVWEAV